MFSHPSFLKLHLEGGCTLMTARWWAFPVSTLRLFPQGSPVGLAVRWWLDPSFTDMAGNVLSPLSNST